MKKFLAVCVILMLTLAAAVNAGARTAVYVGREVSEDGTTLIAKSNDYQDNFANCVTITERVENQPAG